MARNTLLVYPYFNEEFKIHTDNKKFQLGAVISQNKKLISVHGINLLIIIKLYIARKRAVKHH